MSRFLSLSLFRAPRIGRDMPHVPTDEDRLRAWHAVRKPTLGNAYPWPHLRPKAPAKVFPFRKSA